ncbi:hypothetical protein AURDEDRAFT_125770 [Auricularia subglabra TFB-10046 SS5]|nr:hypothetical protein AURDEDRAFT_125770 [Auricularia subglabra TFB-10046 SS5]
MGEWQSIIQGQSDCWLLFLAGTTKILRINATCSRQTVRATPHNPTSASTAPSIPCTVEPGMFSCITGKTNALAPSSHARDSQCAWDMRCHISRRVGNKVLASSGLALPLVLRGGNTMPDETPFGCVRLRTHSLNRHLAGNGIVNQSRSVRAIPGVVCSFAGSLMETAAPSDGRRASITFGTAMAYSVVPEVVQNLERTHSGWGMSTLRNTGAGCRFLSTAGTISGEVPSCGTRVWANHIVDDESGVAERAVQALHLPRQTFAVTNQGTLELLAAPVSLDPSHKFQALAQGHPRNICQSVQESTSPVGGRATRPA